MRHSITHIIEPARLLLRWQSSLNEAAEDRTHWIVGELRRNSPGQNDNVELRYLRASEDFAGARECGFDGYPAFPHTSKDYAGAVLDVFMKRLPPRSRGDFGDYLEFHCLPPDAVISDFALLGYTGAKLPSDGFSLIHPFDDTEGPCEFRMDVAGWRNYREALPRLRVDLPVRFEPEPDNPHDKLAIRVVNEETLIGYVPRGLTDAFHRWFGKSDVSAVIHSVPLPEERPELALFVTVRPRNR